jgi:hypothetical protein
MMRARTGLHPDQTRRQPRDQLGQSRARDIRAQQDRFARRIDAMQGKHVLRKINTKRHDGAHGDFPVEYRV